MDVGFEGDAAFFDIVAEHAIDANDKKELHRVADTYRGLSVSFETPPQFHRTRADGWRFRAEECRTLADQFVNETCRQQLERLATAYDKMAASYDTTDFLNSLCDTKAGK
jgi:hypothetical protein